MWKKAFVILLSVDLLIAVAGAVWFARLPQAAPAARPPASLPSQGQMAPIRVAMGASAINTYLQYELAKQPDLSRVLSYARVSFGSNWQVQSGLRLAGRVVPADIAIRPQIAGGNLGMQIQNAKLGGVPVPLPVLMFLLQRLPWPNWTAVDQSTDTLQLNFTDRPQTSYGLRVLGYSPTTKQLSLMLLVAPKSALPSHG